MKKVTIEWVVDDVKEIAPDLDQKQCEEVLDLFDRYHDGSMESMWDDLRLHADAVRSKGE